jgi:outer membrane protein assembly factor BamA
VFVFCALLVASTPATAQDGLIVRQLKFEGNKSIDETILAAAIATTNSSWFARTPVIRAIGLGEKRRLNQRDLERDVERLRILYRAYGFMQATVDTVVRRTTENSPCHGS